jgi:hypothetical protein
MQRSECRERLDALYEVIADRQQHLVGEREIVDWTRPDGVTYYNVPLVYLQQVSAEDYYQCKPHQRGLVNEAACYFWRVSVD